MFRSHSLPLCVLSFFFLTSITSAHMEMKSPFPLKSKFAPKRMSSDIDYSNTSPLSADGSQFPCKGDISGPLDTSNDDSPLLAGQSYTMQLSGSAFHNGGSCQISLSYDNGTTFRVIKSFIGGCPSGADASLPYTIPKYAPQGHAYLAWTWLNHVGNREFYMNCAYVSIKNVNGSDPSMINSQPGIWVANQASVNNCTTTEGDDPVFPHPGDDVVYGAGLSASSPLSPASCEVPLTAGKKRTGNKPLIIAAPGDSSTSSDLSILTSTISDFIGCISSDIPITVTETSTITSYYCSACLPTTFVTVSCDSSMTDWSSSSEVSSTEEPPTTIFLPPPTTILSSPHTTRTWSSPDILPYADPSDFSPYYPCEPGTFICTDASTFWTCDVTVWYTYTWQYPRQVAAGMECLPSLSPNAPGQGQMPGAPPGYFRDDQYVRARPYGSCYHDGDIKCIDDGYGWLMCDQGGWVDMGGVAAGTRCVDGHIGADGGSDDSHWDGGDNGHWDGGDN